MGQFKWRLLCFVFSSRDAMIKCSTPVSSFLCRLGSRLKEPASEEHHNSPCQEKPLQLVVAEDSETDTLHYKVRSSCLQVEGSTINKCQQVISQCKCHHMTLSRDLVPSKYNMTHTSSVHAQSHISVIPLFVHSQHILATICLRLTHILTRLPAVAAISWTNNPLILGGTVRSYRGQSRIQVSGNRIRGSHYSEDNKGDSGADAETSDQSLEDRRTQRENEYKDLDALQRSREVSTSEAAHDDIVVTRKPADQMTLPELSRTSFNIVPYVSRSVTLQNLVRLGVDLSKVQRVPGVAEHLIKSDFGRDIVPLLRFLSLVGVQADKFSKIFSTNPLLFLEKVTDLELRIGYLLHMMFTLKEVAAIVTAGPVVLLMDPLMLDKKFSFLQQVFNLTDPQVREVVKLCPQLLPWKQKLLADVKFHVKEFMGFTDSDIQQLLLKDPKVFMTDKRQLVNTFDYLYNHMMIPHKHILTWPTILRSSLFQIKNRHLFLLFLDRAQYDPHKESYVSLRALAWGTDKQFCQTVAKCDVQEFYNFCKTL